MPTGLTCKVLNVQEPQGSITLRGVVCCRRQGLKRRSGATMTSSGAHVLVVGLLGEPHTVTESDAQGRLNVELLAQGVHLVSLSSEVRGSRKCIVFI